MKLSSLLQAPFIQRHVQNAQTCFEKSKEKTSASEKVAAITEIALRALGACCTLLGGVLLGSIFIYPPAWKASLLVGIVSLLLGDDTIKFTNQAFSAEPPLVNKNAQTIQELIKSIDLRALAGTTLIGPLLKLRNA